MNKELDITMRMRWEYMMPNTVIQELRDMAVYFISSGVSEEAAVKIVLDVMKQTLEDGLKELKQNEQEGE